MNSLQSYSRIVFFTGAGMSAESGVPTYRGKDGIWEQYNYHDIACQKAFEKDPKKVLVFHEMRRKLMLSCLPHAGHEVLAAIESQHPEVIIVTQNIDGMHQRAGSRNVIELHGGVWRMRCEAHGVFEDMGETYRHHTCPHCNAWLRPDITWFNDAMNDQVMKAADDVVSRCDLFVAIGTSAIVWPAAGFPELARDYGAWCVEINPEATKLSSLYHETIRLPASEALRQPPFTTILHAQDGHNEE